jgi:hypothetical protein
VKQQSTFNAIVPTPWTILGLKLKPFALGHLVLLHRLESPFITGAPPTYADLSMAVLMCSQTFEEAIESLSDPELDKVMADWATKLNENGPINLDEKCAAFESYMNEGKPTEGDLYYSYDPQRTRASSLAVVHAVRVRVQGHSGFSDSEIFNRPWWLCYLDDHIIKDLAGIIEIVEKSDHDDARDVANRLQKLIDEKGIKWPQG